MQAFVDAKFDGIVLAGVGDGNFYKDVFDVALKLARRASTSFAQAAFLLVLHV